MTQSPYLADLLSLTKSGFYDAPEFAERMASASDDNERRRIFEARFDQFSPDIERRFIGTIGLHKAIVAVADALPGHQVLKRDMRHLLSGSVRDFEFMTEVFFECDLHGKELWQGVAEVVARFARTLETLSVIAAAIGAQPEGAPSRLGVLPLLRLVMRDYDLLISFFEAYAPSVKEDTSELPFLSSQAGSFAAFGSAAAA